MPTEQGFSNQKKKGKAQFKTIHSVNNDAFAESIIPKYLWDVTSGVPITIDAVEEILGSNGQVEFWKLEIVGHGATAGNVVRMASVGDLSLVNFEFDIISVVDSDHVLILPISSVQPQVGDSVFIKAWVTASSDADGNLQVAATAIKFTQNGVDVTVNEDTVTPANNRPLPVKLTDVTGDITISAHNLDVATVATEDSIAIGDGTSGNLAKVGLNSDASTYALKVKDDDANASLTTLVNKLPAGIIPVKFDQIVTTYVGATTDISTVVYKSAGVTVATLTLSYDGSNRLIDVTRT